jgi:hypothetical protein
VKLFYGEPVPMPDFGTALAAISLTLYLPFEKPLYSKETLVYSTGN